MGLSSVALQVTYDDICRDTQGSVSKRRLLGDTSILWRSHGMPDVHPKKLDEHLAGMQENGSTNVRRTNVADGGCCHC